LRVAKFISNLTIITAKQFEDTKRFLINKHYIILGLNNFCLIGTAPIVCTVVSYTSELTLNSLKVFHTECRHFWSELSMLQKLIFLHLGSKTPASKNLKKQWNPQPTKSHYHPIIRSMRSMTLFKISLAKFKTID